MATILVPYGDSDGKESGYNAGNLGSIPGSRKMPWNPFQYSWLENPMNGMDRQKIQNRKMRLPGWKVSNVLLGKSGGQLLIAPERMKWLRQSRNGILCGCVWQ